MEYRFETEYNAKTLAVLSNVLGKTMRKKRRLLVRIFGWSSVFLTVLIAALRGFVLDWITVFDLIVVSVLVIILLFEDRIDGYVAAKTLLPGTEYAETVFSKESFTSRTEVGKTEWKYDRIQAIAETDIYFVFIFTPRRGQLYDKRSIQGGTPEAFRCFITAATGKTVRRVR